MNVGLIPAGDMIESILFSYLDLFMGINLCCCISELKSYIQFEISSFLCGSLPAGRQVCDPDCYGDCVLCG